MARPSRMTGRRIPRATRLCKILESDIRRRILIELASGPVSVNDIAERIGTSPPNASINLGRLYDQDLVTIAAEGTKKYYGLTDWVTVSRRGGVTSVTIQASDGSSLTLQSPKM